MEYHYFSVITPGVFKEYKLPANLDDWSETHQRRFERLERLADQCHTYIRQSTYRLG